VWWLYRRSEEEEEEEEEEETLSALFVLKKVGRFSLPEMLGILDLRDIYEQYARIHSHRDVRRIFNK
jgi:hypothetical protein